MGVILDSCVWVGLSSGQVAKEAVVSAAGDATVFTSVITMGELAFGVEEIGRASCRERV